MRHWTFLDFRDVSGNSVILEWINGIPDVQARADIHTLIRTLELIDRPSRRDLKRLTRGTCKGLLELRVTTHNVQYRPLGFYGPGRAQVTLLIGATERDRKFSPSNACETAKKRLAQVAADARGRTCEHREHEA